jgi:hypothetical protein
LKNKYILILLFAVCPGLISLSGCVSRYTPLKHVKPLSGKCDDYAEFSVAIIKQRDQGFTKRATINIASFSVGNSVNRDMLYRKYKPIFEIVYADYQIRTPAIRATGRVLCDHQLTKSWSLLINENYKQVAEIVRLCQDANFAEVDMSRCILARAQGKPDPDLEKPPV